MFPFSLPCGTVVLKERRVSVCVHSGALAHLGADDEKGHKDSSFGESGPLSYPKVVESEVHAKHDSAKRSDIFQAIYHTDTGDERSIVTAHH